MFNAENPKNNQIEQGSSLYAALARTLTRGAALFFARPVRLFRPSKVSGWMFLQGLASQNGTSLSPQFLRDLVKKNGLSVFPRHFIPPLAINTLLGTALWTTYAETSKMLDSHLSHPLAVSLASGAVAGGAQAILAAPAENVRLVLEGASFHSGWSDAWKDVFLGAAAEQKLSKIQSIREARQVRLWMREVGEMAGRGWNGWTWGFGKDVCGFAVFFSIFELTRRTAITLKNASVDYFTTFEGEHRITSHVPRIVHGTTLVGGGVLAGLAYEIVGRPWDVARRTVHIQQVISSKHSTTATPLRALLNKGREDGILSFFRSRTHTSDNTGSTTHSVGATRRRAYFALRALGRVGPWGAGFLIWEALGPGLAPLNS